VSSKKSDATIKERGGETNPSRAVLSLKEVYIKFED
jgi:hypothetical protein